MFVGKLLSVVIVIVLRSKVKRTFETGLTTYFDLDLSAKIHFKCRVTDAVEC